MFKHLHLHPHKYRADGRGYGMDFRVFEERKLYLEGNEEGVDFLDTLMAYIETALDLDSPEEKFGPLSTWQDTKPASSLPISPAEAQEKSLMDKLNDLYPLDQPKVPTKNGYKIMPPWSVPMPWNFDKERDIFDNHAAIPLYLQGMTIRVDWPTYTIRPALTRAQERRLEETSPDIEMAKLHMLGHRMIFAYARLNDWVRYMNETRQVIPLHLYLAGTVLPDNLAHSWLRCRGKYDGRLRRVARGPPRISGMHSAVRYCRRRWRVFELRVESVGGGGLCLERVAFVGGGVRAAGVMRTMNVGCCWLEFVSSMYSVAILVEVRVGLAMVLSGKY